MKIVKKTWIAILALATAVVGACTSTKRATEQTDTSNKPADNDNLAEGNPVVSKDSIPAKRAEMQARLESLRATIKDRETSCVYGPPEVMKEYSARTRAMRREADSLQNELMNVLESERSVLKERLDSIDETVRSRSGAKVYGPPEVMDRYNARSRELRQTRDSLENEIGKIDSEINNLKDND